MRLTQLQRAWCRKKFGNGWADVSATTTKEVVLERKRQAREAVKAVKPAPPAASSSEEGEGSTRKRKACTTNDSASDVKRQATELPTTENPKLNECVICFEPMKKLSVHLPCAHVCCCDECYEALPTNGTDKRCPMCRETVATRTTLYM